MMYDIGAPIFQVPIIRVHLCDWERVAIVW